MTYQCSCKLPAYFPGKEHYLFKQCMYLPNFSAENPLRCLTDTQRKATRLGYRIALVALFLNHHGKEETGKVELLLKVWHC